MSSLRTYFYGEVVPFTVMITVECTNVGLTTIFKKATNQGLTLYVFNVFSYLISTIFLLPLVLIFHRKKKLPPLTTLLVLKMIFLGTVMFTTQFAAFKGIEYASPTLYSAVNNLTPAFTFALAVIFRTEMVSLRKVSSLAKIIGTIISISGALLVVLYKGPQIIKLSSSVNQHSQITAHISQSNWIIGSAILATNSLLISICYILQNKILKEYPAELVVVFSFELTSAIISTPIALIANTHSNAWKIGSDIRLVAILYAGIIGSLDTIVHAWGVHVKGPVYVSLFKPLSIAIAAFMGVIFLSDSLYLGSIIGALIISFGFYIVMCGKMKEELENDTLIERHVEVSST